jgi:hypothetical protein
MRKNKPQNLNEQLSRMQRLMEFNIGEHSHDVLAEQVVDQSIDTGTPANQGGRGTVRGNVGVGVTGRDKPQKATEEDISNLTEDVFAKEILATFSSGGRGKLGISEEQAKEMSKAYVSKAQVKGSSTNKKFKEGLLNGQLNFKRTLPNTQKVELDVLGQKVTANWSVNGMSIKGESGTETPEIPIYDSNMKVIFKSANPTELSNWITNQNISLFKAGEQQYYLTTFKKISGEWKPSQQGFFMAVKGKTLEDSIVTIGVGSAESTPGSETPPTPTEEKIPVELTVEMGESFKTDFDTFKDPKAARNMLLTKIKEELNKKGYSNLDISDVSVVSSASNYYGGVVDFTHDKSGNPVKGGINFNQQPTKTNDTNVDKNNLLAWNRGLRILNLLKQTNGSDLGDNLGKVTITDGANESVEWRVTDTGGKVDPAGKEGAGQYAKLFIKGVAIRTEKGFKPGQTTPGSNEANLRQTIIYLDSSSSKGGIRMATWFDLRRAKYDKSGKKGRLTPGTFSGLPKWLDAILYK